MKTFCNVNYDISAANQCAVHAMLHDYVLLANCNSRKTC